MSEYAWRPGVRAWRRAALLIVVVASGACGKAAPRAMSGLPGGGSARVGGTVISTVDGAPITIDEVRSLVAGSGLAPAEALRRLQGERLLMAEAERRGLRSVPEVRHVARQALVQAVLDEEAARVEVSEAALREAYEATPERFHAPERRASVHVLAPVRTPDEDAAARAFIEGVCRELEAAPNPEASWARYQSQAEPGVRAVQAVAERLPAVDREGPFVREYLDGLFSLAAPGVVPRPVRTRYGWHAIVVTKIERARDDTFEMARDVLRRERLEADRRKHVADWVAGLEREIGVERSAEAEARIAGLEP